MKKAEIKIFLFSLNEASTFSYNNIFVFLSVSVFLFVIASWRSASFMQWDHNIFGGVGSGLSKVYCSINISLLDLNLELFFKREEWLLSAATSLRV